MNPRDYSGPVTPINLVDPMLWIGAVGYAAGAAAKPLGKLYRKAEYRRRVGPYHTFRWTLNLDMPCNVAKDMIEKHGSLEVEPGAGGKLTATEAAQLLARYHIKSKPFDGPVELEPRCAVARQELLVPKTQAEWAEYNLCSAQVPLESTPINPNNWRAMGRGRVPTPWDDRKAAAKASGFFLAPAAIRQIRALLGAQPPKVPTRRQPTRRGKSGSNRRQPPGRGRSLLQAIDRFWR